MEPFGIIGRVVVAAKLLGKQVAECGRQFGMTPCGTGRLFAFGKRLGKQCRHGKGQMAQGQPPKGVRASVPQLSSSCPSSSSSLRQDAGRVMGAG